MTFSRFHWAACTFFFLNMKCLVMAENNETFDCERLHLGCWQDATKDAIERGIRLKSDNVLVDCENFAKDLGFSVFAVHSQEYCYTAASAEQTYRKYGESEDCVGGRGGEFSMSVYRVNPCDNIAKYGVATQQSTSENSTASKATDGVVNGSVREECSVNEDPSNSTWWKLRFYTELQVDQIAIWNIANTNEESRIDQVKVYLDESLCGTIKYSPGTNPYKIQCGSHKVQEIKIVGGELDGYLTLCEVQVFSRSPAVNIAKFGSVSQQTTGWGGVASRAVDGNTYGSYWGAYGVLQIAGGTCTHTSIRECPEDDKAWWRLEFPTDVQIDWISVWNRDKDGKDYIEPRIDAAKVYIGDQHCGTIEYRKGTNPYNIYCGSVIGREITILSGNNKECILTLCEVQVFSTNPPDICESSAVAHGNFNPSDGIEGSKTTLICNEDFKTEGSWVMTCRNDSWAIEPNEALPQCVPIITEDCKVEVVSGFLKTVCQNSSRKTFKCATSNTIYDVVAGQDGYSFSNLCENDDRFYQTCGFDNQGGERSSSLLCGQYICQGAEQNKSAICTTGGGIDTCSNLQSAEVCSESIKKDIECDNVCNERDCRDESVCNGYTYTYGTYCGTRYFLPLVFLVVPGKLTSDRAERCDVYSRFPGARSTFLDQYEGPVCQHSVEQVTVPIFNFTRCAAFRYDTSLVADAEAWWVVSAVMPYCTNMMDQTNCTDQSRVAMSCTVNGYKTTISKFAICHGKDDVKICDDGMENNCKQLSPSCLVHKHKMCDGVKDCADNSDEEFLDCKEMTNKTCFRILGDRSLPIPLSWLGDGTVDCVPSEDEQSIWPTCGMGQTMRYVLNNQTCSDDFLCLHGDKKFVPFNQLCDMIDTCGNENEVCKASKGKLELVSTMMKVENNQENTFPQCMRGLKDLRRLQGNCLETSFQYPKKQIFGASNSIQVATPNAQVKCDYVFGEVYLLTSCTGNCESSECPLSRPIKYDSCGRQYKNRIFTLAGREYLTFVTSSRGSYNNNYFLCRNNGCVAYDKVCDLVDDCGDGSDEEMCTNNYICKSSQTRIPKWHECDGRINCGDLSDECNDRCGKEIIDGILLKVSSWIIGSLAVIFNILLIFISFKSVRGAKTETRLSNLLLIISISFGDLLVGGYLFTISIVDQLYGSTYCNNQTEWLSSHYCSVLGVLSTIGSQMSLFSMTTLSIARFIGIKNAMQISTELSKRSYARISAVLVTILIASTAIAVLPLVPHFEDFFVNSMTYNDKSNAMFVGFPDKEVHLKMIKAYYGRSKVDKTSQTWKIITELTDGMFSTIYGGISRNKVEFYGNDGVCLFKYFVKDTDPQKIFSWSILGLNFACFFIISLSYLYINLVSTQSGRVMKNNKHVTRRTRRVQQKIAIIIVTDFLCWVPFIIICCLHTLSVFDATPWYSLFSIVILPINSVINPILYDDTLSRCLMSPFGQFRQSVSDYSKRTITSDYHAAADESGQSQLANNSKKLEKSNKQKTESSV